MEFLNLDFMKRTALVSSLDSAETTMTVRAGADFMNVPCMAVLSASREFSDLAESEHVKVTAKNGDVWTIERAVVGTAKAWPTGTQVYGMWSPEHLWEIHRIIETPGQFTPIMPLFRVWDELFIQEASSEYDGYLSSENFNLFYDKLSGPEIVNEDRIATWENASTLKNGPAFGTLAGQVLRFVDNNKLPVLDGSNLTGVVKNVSAPLQLSAGNITLLAATASDNGYMPSASYSLLHNSATTTVWESSHTGKVPVWGSTARRLNGGLSVGTSANNLVQLDGTGKLPAVDGSQLTNILSSVSEPLYIDGSIKIRQASNAQDGYITAALHTTIGNLLDVAVTTGVTTTEGNIPIWSSTDKVLADGIPIGTDPNNIVALDSSSKLPAVDGSQLTNLPPGNFTIDGAADVTLTSPTTDQILKFDGTAWVNWTPDFGSGVSWGNITGTLSDQTDLNNALNGKLSTAHADDTTIHFTQAQISITESQVSDLGNYLTSVALNDISNVTLTSPATDQILKFNGTSWVNWTPDYSSASVSLTQNQIAYGDSNNEITSSSNLTFDNILFNLNSFQSDIDNIKMHNFNLSNMLSDNKWTNPIPSRDGWGGWSTTTGSTFHGSGLELRYLRQTSAYTSASQSIAGYATVGDTLLFSIMLKDKLGMNDGGEFTIFTGDWTQTWNIDSYLDGKPIDPASTSGSTIQFNFPTDGKWHLYELQCPVVNLGGDNLLRVQLTRGGNQTTEAYILFVTACLNTNKIRSIINYVHEDYIIKHFKENLFNKKTMFNNEVDIISNLTVAGDYSSDGDITIDGDFKSEDGRILLGNAGADRGRVSFKPNVSNPTLNTYNVDNNGGRFRIFREDQDGTNGVVAIWANDSGQVGIGALQPDEKFDVIINNTEKFRLRNDVSSLFLTTELNTSSADIIGSHAIKLTSPTNINLDSKVVYKLCGRATVSNNVGTIEVTGISPTINTTKAAISVIPNWNTTVWVDSVTSSSFRVNFGSNSLNQSGHVNYIYWSVLESQ